MAKRKNPRHCFEFSIASPGGDAPRVIKVWCKVTGAKKKVALRLTKEHVEASIAAHGVGNTQNCSMAICAQRHAKSFPHPVVGFIDWQYRTAYVVTKLDKNGWPCQCMRYTHSDKVARFQDSPGGQKALLKRITKNGGHLDVVMRPYQKNTWTKGHRPTGVNLDGSRKRSTSLGMGAKRRFAVAHAGRLPPGTTTIDNSR